MGAICRRGLILREEQGCISLKPFERAVVLPEVSELFGARCQSRGGELMTVDYQELATGKYYEELEPGKIYKHSTPF
jgi:hypothetical protein